LYIRLMRTRTAFGYSGRLCDLAVVGLLLTLGRSFLSVVSCSRLRSVSLFLAGDLSYPQA
jgi:hypothetical protein